MWDGRAVVCTTAGTGNRGAGVTAHRNGGAGRRGMLGWRCGARPEVGSEPTPPADAVQASDAGGPAGETIRFTSMRWASKIYTRTGGGGGTGGAATYSWEFKAPDAELFDSGGAQVGTHGAGPHWRPATAASSTARRRADSLARRRCDPLVAAARDSTSGPRGCSATSATWSGRHVGREGAASGCDSTIGRDGAVVWLRGRLLLLQRRRRRRLAGAARRPPDRDRGPGCPRAQASRPRHRRPDLYLHRQ